MERTEAKTTRPLSRSSPFTFLAQHEHWIDHLAPVWKQLGEGGPFYTTDANVGYARAQGVDALPFPAWPKFTRLDRVVVAGESDRRRVPTVPVVRFEHGCGISYAGGVPIPPGVPRRALTGIQTHHSYAGGRGQNNVVAFLNPNDYAQERWRQAYPKPRAEIVGTPKMDRWHKGPVQVSNGKPVVAVSFHADFTVCPESRSTFSYYREALLALIKRTDIRVVAHVHPRARKMVQGFYEDNGIEFWPHFADVLDQADVYVVDNSSTLYEFASTDRPVVVLNAPYYRRDVHHGLRFWEHSDIGPNVEHPRELSLAVDEALEDPEPYSQRRQEATVRLYPYRGRAAERAVEVLRSLVS